MKQLKDSTPINDANQENGIVEKKHFIQKLKWWLNAPIRTQAEFTRLHTAMAELNKRLKP